MVAFNPTEPKQYDYDPSFIGYSKAIEQPKPDTSKGKLLAGVGNVLDSAVNTANDLEQMYIKDKIQTGVDAERGKNTSELERLNIAARYAQATGDIQTDASAPPGTDIITTPSKTTQPAALASLPGKVDTLVTARNKGYSETAYWGRINALASQMNNMFPGQKDYISSVFEKAGAGQSANKYMASLLGDINSFAAKQDAEHNKIEGLIIEEARRGTNPGKLMALKQAWDEKRASNNDVIGFVARENGWRAKMEENKALREDRKGELGENADSAKRDAEFTANHAALQGLDSYEMTTGFRKEIDAAIAGGQPPDGRPMMSQQHAQDIAAKLMSQKENVIRDAIAESHSKGHYQYGNSDEMDKTIRDRVSSVWDPYVALIKDQQFGLATMATRAAKNMTDETVRRTLEIPGFGEWLAKSKTLGELGGKDLQTAFYKNAQQGKLPEQLKTYNEMNLMDVFNTGKPFKKTSEEIVNKHLADDNPAKAAELLQGDLRTLDVIGDPKISSQAQYNVAMAAFGPNNQGFIDTIARDYVVPEGKPGAGRMVPGKFAAWQRMTSPGVVGGLQELSKTHPDVVPAALEWGTNEFAKLFQDEVKNLQSFPNTVLRYDPEAHQFRVEPGDQVFQTPETRRAVDIANRQLYALNGGLQNYARILGLDSSRNASADIMRVLMRLGYDPNNTGIEPGASASRQTIFNIGEAIANAFRNKPKSINEP